MAKYTYTLRTHVHVFYMTRICSSEEDVLLREISALIHHLIAVWKYYDGDV